MPIRLIHSENADAGARELSALIANALNSGMRTLWLVPGGSNIATAVAVMNAVREAVPIGALGDLTVSLSDERYGPVGHPDSNWEQLDEAGFDLDNILSIPVLRGLPLAETVAEYGAEIMSAFERSEVRAALLGIGSDGHIAGILPHSPAVAELGPVSGYQAGELTRITLSPGMLVQLSSAFAFAFGPAKAEAIHNLANAELSLQEQPAQILKAIPEAHVYSDQLP